jgi:predicted O-methyltransferase YrrM
MDIDVIPASAKTELALQSALTSAWQILSQFRAGVAQQNDLFIYFKSLDDVLTGFSESGALESVESVMRHVFYLADRAGCGSAIILGGGSFAVEPQIILDTLANVSTELSAISGRRAVSPPDGIPAEVFALVLEAEARLTGWCSREKALTMVRTILQERPQICVEIGVFGGRSLVPCAAALRHNGVGVIYGIEAWSQGVAVANPTNDVNDEWWSKVDFSRIKQEFYRFISATNLTHQVRVIEAPSGRAAVLLDQIDFLHIDGSHSVVNAAEDVILYARKVRSGGIVVFDDVNWQSTAPARELLNSLCDTVTMLQDPESGQDICAVLRRH